MLRYLAILRLREQGLSLRRIAASTGNSRQKVTDVIDRATEKGLIGPFDDDMTDKWIKEFLFPERTLESSGRHPIDFDYVHRELAKPSVTLSLLHYEYETECRTNKRTSYSYRSFIRHYSAYANKHKATLRIRRRLGEVMEVDWAGSTAFFIDRDTGEKIKAYILVATLLCSQLSYAEASLSMDLSAWVTCHNHAYAYFGGSTQILIPDNLMTGVTRNTSRELILNPTYRAMALFFTLGG